MECILGDKLKNVIHPFYHSAEHVEPFSVRAKFTFYAKTFQKRGQAAGFQRAALGIQLAILIWQDAAFSYQPCKLNLNVMQS